MQWSLNPKNTNDTAHRCPCFLCLWSRWVAKLRIPQQSSSMSRMRCTRFRPGWLRQKPLVLQLVMVVCHAQHRCSKMESKNPMPCGIITTPDRILIWYYWMSVILQIECTLWFCMVCSQVFAYPSQLVKWVPIQLAWCFFSTLLSLFHVLKQHISEGMLQWLLQFVAKSLGEDHRLWMWSIHRLNPLRRRRSNKSMTINRSDPTCSCTSC